MTSNDDNLSLWREGKHKLSSRFFFVLYLLVYKVDLSTIPCQATCSNSANCISMSAIKLALYHQLHGPGPIVSKPSPKLNRSSKMKKMQLAKYVFISQQTE